MGDAGSGFLGYILSVAAIVTARESAVGLLVWLILGGVFFVDATLTLARRLLRGERLHEAHRSHAYQNLSRRWGSHAKVTLLVVAVNVLWLIPLAAFALSHPRWAGWIAVTALVPVIAAAAWAGAGKSAS